MSLATVQEWKNFLEKHPNVHLLQTAEWGILKENFNWKVVRIIVGNTGAQVLLRRLIPGVIFAYIPKGPIGINWHTASSNNSSWTGLFEEINAICREEKVFLLKIEPDLWEIVETPDSDHESINLKYKIDPPYGFRMSKHSIQPQRTFVVDLSGGEERILSRMKQKTRYNIGLARRKDIIVHPSGDLNTFFHLMKETGSRDQFFVHHPSYYQMAYDLFQPSGYCEMLQAESEGNSIAALMVFAFGKRSWYLFGASSNLHRERMPSYLLQWEAMLWAKRRGCNEYDLWGVPDESYQSLEEQFLHRSDRLWGVYRFKRGFGGELRRAAGPWDLVYNPLLYNLYNWRVKSRASVT